MASPRRPRSKSARARLVTTKMELEEALVEQKADYVGSKRAKSALSNRTRAECSRSVLPKHLEGDEFEQTHYTSHFEGKAGETPDVRPSSPTRRNNPHPAEEFMQWKLPTRVLESRQGTIRPPEKASTGTKERFYEDYLGGNDGDAHNEVPITNVAKIEFPGYATATRNSIAASFNQGFRGVSGTKVQLSHRQTKTASQKRRVLSATAKDSSAANGLRSWLDSDAPEEEKKVILNMLESGATDELRLKQSLQATLNPSALPGIEEWLLTASAQEREVATKVFEELASRAKTPAAPHAYRLGGHSGKMHYRRASDPLPVAQINPPPMLYRHAGMTNAFSRHITYGGASRAASRNPRPVTGSSSHRSHTPGACNHCDQSRLEQMFSRMEVEAKHTQQTPGRGRIVSPMPAMHWHLYSKRDPTPNVFHRGAVFSMPDKYRGSHFDISPEWPTA